ncbi:efflux RND transporter periplasmic adaptor subunit [Pontiellaceae bacterium B12219]|nr:efflux RND transporter periplasmic adaptor subunit [Pontiellaceae bacterium B12219]
MKKAMKWIIVLVVLGGVGTRYFKLKLDTTETAKPSYDEAVVEVRDIRIVVESTGEVQPRNRLDVKPPIAGRLEELLVDEGDKVTKGQILGWISSTERATLLDAALATSKEELDYWADLYKPSPLISPLNGTIIARNFEPGQSIGVSDAVLVIADDLIIVANLDETDVGQIKNDQAVVVSLEAYPDSEFPCVVEKIAYDATTVQNVTMYEVDVRPDRVPRFARSGMTANLEFVVEEKEKVLTLPASAIQQKSGSKSGAKSGSGKRPDFSNMSEDERKKAMTERMRERGMSESEIKERLAQGGPGGGAPGGSARKSGGSAKSFVLIESGDPDNPTEVEVQVGVSDGSYTEITEGLEEGDTVLIRRISLGSSAKKGGSSFMSSMTGGRRGR